jgi:hypothetical protein
VILRGESTLGGGVVLDPSPPRHRDARRVELVESGAVAATVHDPVLAASLRHLLDEEPSGLGRAGPWVFSQSWLEELEQTLRAHLERADPLDPGIPSPPDPWAGDVVQLLPFERRGSKLYLPGVAGSLGDREAEAEAFERELEGAGARATKVEDAELVRFLEASGRVVRLGDGFAISAGRYAAAQEILVEECRSAGDITLARFRDLVGIGRRDAQLLLERFDADGVTRRVGDRRVLRRAAASTPSSQS